MKCVTAGRANVYSKSPPARVVWIEIQRESRRKSDRQSPPARVVWIEMGRKLPDGRVIFVATREGGVD